MAHEVTLIPGDGTGPELTEATRRVLEATGAEFEWDVQQAHPVLDKFVVDFSDATDKGSLTEIFSKWGKKVTVKKPKKGAKKP